MEQDPKEILQAVIDCIKKTIEKLKDVGLSTSDIKAVGITNQRETTLLWDKDTGEPLHNAIGNIRGPMFKCDCTSKNLNIYALLFITIVQYGWI